MAQSADERLVVMMEARISEFEKRMNKADRTGTDSYRRLRAGSRGATQQMEQDMARSTSRINQALASTSSQVGTFAKSFAVGFAGGAIATAVAGLTSNLNATVRAVAELGDEAKRAGLAVEAFQEWKFVAEQNRIGVDSLVDGFKELSLRADEFVVTGGGSAADAFKRLGLSAADLKTKLKDPSALMLEIIGRLEGMDKAAQIRIADEVFGGTGGERFVELLAQGEAGLRKTIDRAHEVGSVMDSEMIEKAQELDRRWQALTARVANFGKALAVALADIPLDMVETRLNEIFTDIEGKNILGADLYEALRSMGVLTDEQVEKLRGLRAEYQRLGDDARSASNDMLAASEQVRLAGYDEAADQLAAAALEMRNLADQFDANTISGETFRKKLGEVQTSAVDALDVINEIDRSNFSGAISQAEALGKAIGDVAQRAWDAVNGLRAAAGMEPEGGYSPDMDRFSNPYASGEVTAQEAGPDNPRPRGRPMDLGDPGTSTKKSGGGSGSTRIDSLIADLATEEELLTEWYEKSLEMLNGATEQQLEALGGKHEAIERLEKEHADRLAAIEDAKNSFNLQSALGAGADILGALGSTSEKALKISQGFAAAEALVSTYKGAAKELEKGTLGFATAAAVIAKGFAFIAAIKGAKGSSTSTTASSSTSSSSEAATTSAAKSQNIQFTGTHVGQQTMEELFKQINQGIKDGYTIYSVEWV